MIVASGTFKGWSVAQVLAEANKALGGLSTYTASELTNVLSSINQNNDEGSEDHGFLVSPCTSITPHNDDELVKVVEQSSTSSEESSLTIDQSYINFKSKRSSKVCLSVFDQNGKQICTLFNGEVKANESKRVEFNKDTFKSGIYVVRLVTESCVTNTKFVK
jgi:hypothetical protein